MRPSHSPTEPAIERTLVELGRNLADAFSSVIGQMLDSPPSIRPSRLDAATGVGKDVAYRIVKAVRAEDPITVVHLLPGPAPLRRLLKAATKHAVSPSAIAQAGQVVDDFERFIRFEAGDRGTLDLILSGWLPEARQKGELLAKQAVFRGMSHVKGLSADVLFDVAIFRPSQNPERVDGTTIFGLKGFRRWRRDAELRYASRRVHPPREASRALRLDGQPINDLQDLVVAEFSSISTGQLDVVRSDTGELYTLRAEGLGLRSATDIAVAYLTQACLTRYRVPDSNRRSGPTCDIVVPTRRVVFDVLVHADIYPNSQPQLYLYETAFCGVADLNDPTRDPDRLPMNETISTVGTGVDGLRLAEVPRYVDLLRHVFARLGWDARAFRAYRCQIEYPLYGTQVTMAFERAPRP